MEMNAENIAALVKSVISQMGTDTGTVRDDGIPVGISNRHVHLTREHVDILFGEGYRLNLLKDLSQPGQYACKETVTILGPSLRPIENVRVLGPERKASQVEISKPILTF